MRSLKGDADIYVSDKTLRPSFDTYKLQSVTCGQDVVIVPRDFVRPVGIAIYGHPSYKESEFEMRVFYDQTVPQDPFDKGSYTSEDGGQPSKSPQAADENIQEEESILWTILIGLLKIILEILFWKISSAITDKRRFWATSTMWICFSGDFFSVKVHLKRKRIKKKRLNTEFKSKAQNGFTVCEG